VFFDERLLYSFRIGISVSLMKMEVNMIFKNILIIFIVVGPALLGRYGNRFPKLWGYNILNQKILCLNIGVSA